MQRARFMNVHRAIFITIWEILDLAKSRNASYIDIELSLLIVFLFEISWYKDLPTHDTDRLYFIMWGQDVCTDVLPTQTL